MLLGCAPPRPEPGLRAFARAGRPAAPAPADAGSCLLSLKMPCLGGGGWPGYSRGLSLAALWGHPLACHPFAMPPRPPKAGTGGRRVQPTTAITTAITTDAGSCTINRSPQGVGAAGRKARCLRCWGRTQAGDAPADRLPVCRSCRRRITCILVVWSSLILQSVCFGPLGNAAAIAAAARPAALLFAGGPRTSRESVVPLLLMCACRFSAARSDTPGRIWI